MSDDCPRAKSNTTPCYLRDGELVVVESPMLGELCVGCDTPLEAIEDRDPTTEEDGDEQT